MLHFLHLVIETAVPCHASVDIDLAEITHLVVGGLRIG